MKNTTYREKKYLKKYWKYEIQNGEIQKLKTIKCRNIFELNILINFDFCSIVSFNKYSKYKILKTGVLKYEVQKIWYTESMKHVK